MSPHAEAYLAGAHSLVSSQLVYVPRGREYLTQIVWDRMAKALNRPASTSKVILEARRG